MVFEPEDSLDPKKLNVSRLVWTGNFPPVLFVHWSLGARPPERAQIQGGALEKWAFSPKKRDFFALETEGPKKFQVSGVHKTN